jgi:branched-chain amino acid transport system permease protein
LLAGVVGFLVGLPALRLRGVFLAMATIGFIEALAQGVILNLPITGEGLGLKNPDADPITGINAVLVSLVVIVFVMWRLTTGRLGRALSAIRQDELAALSQGIHVARYKMIAFVLSALLAGFAGGLESHLNFFVDPNEYGVSRTVQVLTFAVLGGSGNIFGPVVGALFLTSLPEIIRFQDFDYRDVIAGVILIAVIIFRPQGIVGRGGLAIVRPRWWPRARTRVTSAATPG